MPTDACASCIRLSMMIASVSTVGFLLGPTAGAQITVGQNVQVSVAQAKYPMGEVLVTADPTDPNHLLGCGIVYAEAGIRRWTAVYLSTDGGKTWSTTLETKQWEDSADPACSIGPNGVAHHVAIAWQNPKPYVLAVYRSTDGGRTWREEQPIPMKFQGIDRQRHGRLGLARRWKGVRRAAQAAFPRHALHSGGRQQRGAQRWNAGHTV